MSLSDKQKIFAQNIGKLIQYAYASGFAFTLGEFLRPDEMQLIYFNTGRSKLKFGRHQQKLAGDFNIFFGDRLLFQDKAKYMEDVMIAKQLGDYWEGLHPDNRWGADWDRDDNITEETFRDPYHFEMLP